jgi:HEAT repeat protein
MALTSKDAAAFDLDRSMRGNSDAAYALLSRLVSSDPEAQTEIVALLEETQELRLWYLLLETLALHTWGGDPIPVAQATGRDPRRLEFTIRGLLCNTAETPAQQSKTAVLHEALDHEDSSIRYHAALLTGRRGAEAALPYLLELLNSGSEVWAIPAANVIGEMGFTQAADDLVDAIASNLPGLHRAAAQALQELGHPAVPALIRALRHRDNHVRWHAARVLGKIGDPEAIPALIQTMEDVDSGVRWLAAEALSSLGDEILEPLLKDLSHKPINAFLRAGAFHVLAHFQREGLQAVTPIVEALKSSVYGTLVPMAAYEILQKLRRIKSSK